MYQGEELGLNEVADIPDADRQDPAFFRNAGVEVGRGGGCVPMPWTSTERSFGFGDARAHLPQPDWFAGLAVSAPDAAEDSTLNFYRDALALRGRLQTSEELEWITNTKLLHFARPNGWNVVANFGGGAVELPAGEVVVSSVPLEDGRLPANATAWLA